jgi:hypothetical protein
MGMRRRSPTQEEVEIGRTQSASLDSGQNLATAKYTTIFSIGPKQEGLSLIMGLLSLWVGLLTRLPSSSLLQPFPPTHGKDE